MGSGAGPPRPCDPPPWQTREPLTPWRSPGRQEWNVPESGPWVMPVMGPEGRGHLGRSYAEVLEMEGLDLGPSPLPPRNFPGSPEFRGNGKNGPRGAVLGRAARPVPLRSQPSLWGTQMRGVPPWPQSGDRGRWLLWSLGSIGSSTKIRSESQLASSL